MGRWRAPESIPTALVQSSSGELLLQSSCLPPPMGDTWTCGSINQECKCCHQTSAFTTAVGAMMLSWTCACVLVCLCHDVKFNLCCFHIGLPSPLSTRILTGHLEARAPLALMQSRVVSQNKYPWKRPEPCCCCKNMTFWAIASAFITCDVYLTWSVDGRFVSPVSGWVSDW